MLCVSERDKEQSSGYLWLVITLIYLRMYYKCLSFMVHSSRCKKTPTPVDLVVREVINSLRREVGNLYISSQYPQDTNGVKFFQSFSPSRFSMDSIESHCFTGFIVSCCSSLGLQLKRRQPVYSMYSLLRPQHLAGLSPV